MNHSKILLVGCGKMGGALLSGWLEQGIPAKNIQAIEPFQDFARPFLDQGITFHNSLDVLDTDFAPDFVLFAIKPQIMDEVIPAYSRFSGKCTFISIAAGKTTSYFERKLGKDSAIIRTMPNMPASIRQGVTVACGNPYVTSKAKETCLSLLTAVGEANWLDDERLIDAVTAVSGSGPAYVFLLAETMAKAGINAGLSPKIAHRLASQTIAGSGALLVQSDENAETLRESVTSPGGTTEAALSILMGKNGVQKLISEAVSKAIERSKELAG